MFFSLICALFLQVCPWELLGWSITWSPAITPRFMHRCTPHINRPYYLEEIYRVPYFPKIALSFLYHFNLFGLFLNENYFWHINRPAGHTIWTTYFPEYAVSLQIARIISKLEQLFRVSTGNTIWRKLTARSFPEIYISFQLALHF